MKKIFIIFLIFLMLALVVCATGVLGGNQEPLYKGENVPQGGYVNSEGGFYLNLKNFGSGK